MPHRHPALALCCHLLVAVWGATAAANDAPLGVRVPEGFEVTLYADDDLAHDIYSLTVDPRGRVVVSGPGYVKILHDDDGDGRADRATLYSNQPRSGAQGMLFLGDTLYCSGDSGLLRLRDADGDDVADGSPESLLAPLHVREHGIHGIVQGPDGWLYIACGNDAGVDSRHAMAASSPVKEPLCGAVLRVSPDGQQCEVIAHGFRNSYDLAFDAWGRLFLVDSDGERDHHLPWYSETRLFDVAIGMEHGWLKQGWQRSWNRPASFYDNVARAAELGRGSPTGLVAYRHDRFPAQYRGGLFSCCWTLGRVYFLPLEPHGASVVSQPQVFMQTTGDVGFAPVDVAIDPAGDLLVAIGGRGARGGVFRVSHRSDAQPPRDDRANDDPLHVVLNAPQPLSSWSRAAWMPLAAGLGADALAAAIGDASLESRQRVRAVEILVELFDGPSLDAARRAVALDDPATTARVAWALGRRTMDAETTGLVAELTGHADVQVTRAAWEALLRQPMLDSTAAPQPHWRAGLASASRRVRSAVVLAAQGPGAASFARAIPELPEQGSPREVLGYLRVVGLDAESDEATLTKRVRAALSLFVETRDPELRIESVRWLQQALGDVDVSVAPPEPVGYVPANADRWSEALRHETAVTLAGHFPSRHAELDKELGRLLAMLAVDVPGLPDKIVERCTDESPANEDIHYLMVLSRLPGERSDGVTRRTAKALLALDEKMQAAGWHPSRNWPDRIGETFDNLRQNDPALGASLIDDESFGRAAHALYAGRLEGEDRLRAARRLLAVAAKADDEDEEAWSPELVDILSDLPADELLPALRTRWDDYRLRDAIARVLTRWPREEDRPRLIEALGSTRPDVSRAAAEALQKLQAHGAPHEVAAALRALRQFGVAEKDSAAALTSVEPFQQYRPHRKALVELLQHWSGLSYGNLEDADDSLAGAFAEWYAWFAEAHPDVAAEALSGRLGADAAAWHTRLATVDWSAGDAERGERVFEKRSCHRCHRGRSRLGPDLTGAASRMTREDLFTAIVDPSRDVAPLYRTTLIATRSGRVYHGLVVYESPDGTLLQTDPDTTVRITGEELLVQQPSSQSLMPNGLLEGASDQELADLYAYLRTLVPEGAATADAVRSE